MLAFWQEDGGYYPAHVVRTGTSADTGRPSVTVAFDSNLHQRQLGLDHVGDPNQNRGKENRDDKEGTREAGRGRGVGASPSRGAGPAQSPALKEGGRGRGSPVQVVKPKLTPRKMSTPRAGTQGKGDESTTSPEVWETPAQDTPELTRRLLRPRVSAKTSGMSLLSHL